MRLRDCGAALVLRAAMGDQYGRDVGADAYALFLNGQVRGLAPADPVERMMAEQLVLAHHSMGKAVVTAATAQHMEVARAFHGAAARLMAEFRLTALALKSYRTPPPAPEPAQKVAVEASAPSLPSAPVPRRRRSGLGSNPRRRSTSRELAATT